MKEGQGVEETGYKTDVCYEKHEAYKWVRTGCIHNHNLNINSFNTLSGNEQAYNFVHLISF